MLGLTTVEEAQKPMMHLISIIAKRTDIYWGNFVNANSSSISLVVWLPLSNISNLTDQLLLVLLQISNSVQNS